MKREIPQKTDIASSGVSTLLRRTRSVSVLGFMITVSALGGLTTAGQAAHAAVSPAHLKSSTRKPIQLPDLIGSPRYKVSTYQTRNTSKRSRLLQNHVLQNTTPVLIASKPDQASQTGPLLTSQPSTLAIKTAPTQSGALSKSQKTVAGVSFTQSNWVGSAQILADELANPLTSKNWIESIDILDLGNRKDILELTPSDLLDGGTTTTQVVEPLLLAESPQQYLFNDELLLNDELLPQSSDSLEIKKDSSETSAPKSFDSATLIAVLPDIDLSQTIIPNDRNSALIDSGAIVHQVKSGESLDDVARLYQVSAKEIAKANRISDPSSIGPKTKLRIPAHQSLSLSLSAVQDIVDLNDGESNTEPSGLADERDPSESAKSKSGKDDETETTTKTNLPAPVAILPSQPGPKTRLNSGKNIVATRNLLPQVPSLELPPLSSVDRYLPSQMLPGPQKYVWPAKGVLTSGFGWRWGRPHRGIDIAAPVGTPVVAAAPGIVTTAGWNRWGYGNLVEIRHPDGSLTLYAHNQRIKARVGESVSQGQQIADMGSTGRSTGPHTHFELHPAGKGAINPVPFLRRL